MQTKTNQTTQLILDFLLDQHILAYRNNTLPIPITKAGTIVGFRPASKTGRPDIEGIMPGGKYIGVEIKGVGDRLREHQESFHLQVRSLGATILVVKDFNDFIKQWQDL